MHTRFGSIFNSVLTRLKKTGQQITASLAGAKLVGNRTHKAILTNVMDVLFSVGWRSALL